MSEDKKKKTVKKLSEKSALAQVDLMLDYYDIDLDEMGEDARIKFEDVIKELTGHIRRGRVVVEVNDADIKVTQHLKFPPGEVPTIEYGAIKAIHKAATDAAKENPYRRLLILMGAISGLGEAGMKPLKGVDMGVMESLASVFSNV